MNWEGPLVGLIVGILVIAFRKHIRNADPAGVRPWSEKEPTTKGEQWIVIGIGLLFIGLSLAALAGEFGLLEIPD